MYLLSILTNHNVLKIDRSFYYYSNNDVSIYSRVRINFHNQNIIGFVVKKEEFFSISEKEKELGFSLKEIDEIIDQESILNDTLFKLANLIKERYLFSLSGVLNTMLPPSLRSNRKINNYRVLYNIYYELNDKNYVPISIREKKILDTFRSNNLINKEKLNIESKTFKDLLFKNIIKEVKEEKYRYVPKKIYDYTNKIVLSNEQEKALNKIILTDKKAFLLKGRAGSGKTIIYLKLIEDALKENKSTLILVPEIALTPLIVSHILSYFNNINVAILHGSLKGSERYDEYRKIKNKDTKVIIGTRSAIFAPSLDLKYIIIDEEQDESYKQSEDLTYNAKDIALLRSKLENIKVIFGSATPSIEYYLKAKKENLELIELNNRYFNQEKLLTSLIDIKNPNNFSNKSKIFSNYLIDKISLTLKNKEQIILMINRRGYSSYLYCNDCGYIFKCPNCDLSLKYHKDTNKLMCHTCEYETRFKKECPLCHSKNIKLNSFGIEKVEEEFKFLFPSTKYIVLNSDLTKDSNQIENALSKFNNKEVSVLIGTQIVSKGHDFKDVSLVGILNCDTFLSTNSFKANELTFNLIYQTINRTGRFFKGEAIIQTYKKDNKIINFALNEDYESFYKYEIENRKKYFYPPFINLILLRICSKDLYLLNKETRIIKSKLNDILKNDHISLSSFKDFFKGKVTSKILIKTNDIKYTKSILKSLLFKYETNKDISLYLDFFPYNL